MATVRILLLVLHVTSAALLLGGGIGVVAQLKKSRSIGGKSFELAAEEALRKVRIMSGGALLVLVSGLAQIFYIGGFAVAPKNYHAALGLMIVALALILTLLRPSAAKLVQSAKTADGGSGQAAEGSIKKLAAGIGVTHLLWLVMLVLMFVRF